MKLKTCLWFDNNAEEAAKFYTSIFNNSCIGGIAHYGKAGAAASGQKKGSVMMVEFRMDDLEVQAVNGGPIFKFTPALSYFVSLNSEAEINDLWNKLSPGGLVRMGLDKYPWSDRYGWTTDRFGVEWQLMLSPNPKKIAPAFLFVDDLFGKGEEAVNFYTRVIPNSQIEYMGKDEATNTVIHCAFKLNGQDFVLMEGQGKHGYTFNEAFSINIECDTQKEIDSLWEELIKDGGSEVQCGWLKDRYGVSWQINPKILGDIMMNDQKSDKVMAAMLTMKKLDISKLLQAAES